MNTTHVIPTVVLIRHAQSSWNRDGRFTGWADPGLTEAGRLEAIQAGLQLSERGYQFDRVYSSRLKRASETADIIINTSGNGGKSIQQDWRLNERHYGALQGRFKAEMTARAGEQQVWRWRRSYREVPPPMHTSEIYHPANQNQYDDVERALLPSSESLEQTRERVRDFWRENIEPQLKQGQRILISSHGNTLRALIMQLQGMSVGEVEQFEIPTALPIIYAFTRKAEPIGWHYLNDPDTSKAA